MTGHGGKFADKAIGNLSADRQLVVTFEFFDGVAGRLVEQARRLDLTIAIVGQGTLHRRDSRRGTDQIGDRIAAPRSDRLRRWRCRYRSRRDGRVGVPGRIVAGDRHRFGIGEERRRMRARLQEHRVDDDNAARRDRGNDGKRIHRPSCRSGPQPQCQCRGRIHGAAMKVAIGIAAVTHFFSPGYRRGAADFRARALKNYVFIFEQTRRREQTNVFPAMEDGRAAGSMLLYEAQGRGNIVQLRGSRRAVELLLDSIGFERRTPTEMRKNYKTQSQTYLVPSQ